ncbi:hypothetical protein J6590_020467 [Homalodisca vitripennis]|nr:hypothetical protein J6590_020467 [Homalodisca vitripennis]
MFHRVRVSEQVTTGLEARFVRIQARGSLLEHYNGRVNFRWNLYEQFTTGLEYQNNSPPGWKLDLFEYALRRSLLEDHYEQLARISLTSMTRDSVAAVGDTINHKMPQ